VVTGQWSAVNGWRPRSQLNDDGGYDGYGGGGGGGAAAMAATMMTCEGREKNHEDMKKK